MTVADTAVTARKSLRWIPDDFAFYHHQITGVRQMAKMTSAILADDPGLGKTIQVLTVFAIDVERGWAERMLVVSPATLKWNWANEISTHTHFPVLVLDGPPAKRREQLTQYAAETGPRILVINYEQASAHLAELNNLHFDLVAYDEAHAMKNPRAKRTKACMSIRAKRHFPLTGSPILNFANDIWTLLHRVDPNAFPSYYSFVHRFCLFGGFKDKQIIGTKNERELREILSRYMIRRRKDDVLDLPEKQYIQVFVDLTDYQRKVYDSLALGTSLPSIDTASREDIELAITLALRQRQCIGTTACFPGEPDESGKLDYLVELMETLVADNYKTVVFTQWRAVQEYAIQRLMKMGLTPYVLNGDVKIADRVGIVEKWAADEKPNPIVCMLQVAGIGLNMTASRHAIFLDKLYVP